MASKAGRKSLFQTEIRKAVIDGVRQGLSNRDAASQAGISEKTLYIWLAIGRAWQNGVKHARAPHLIAERDEYVEFVQEFKRAQAMKRASAMATVQAVARDRWRHRATGTISYRPPSPITYYNPQTGKFYFEDPRPLLMAEGREDEAVLWIEQASGEAWEYIQANWQTAAWILERTDPDTYARRNFMKIEGLDNLLRVAKQKGIEPEELFEVLAQELMADEDYDLEE